MRTFVCTRHIHKSGHLHVVVKIKIDTKKPKHNKNHQKTHKFDFTLCKGELEMFRHELSGIWLLNFY